MTTIAYIPTAENPINLPDWTLNEVENSLRYVECRAAPVPNEKVLTEI